MKRVDYERVRLHLIAISALAIIDFVIVGIIFSKAKLVGLNDDLLAGVGQMICRGNTHMDRDACHQAQKLVSASS